MDKEPARFIFECPKCASKRIEHPVKLVVYAYGCESYYYEGEFYQTEKCKEKNQ